MPWLASLRACVWLGSATSSTLSIPVLAVVPSLSWVANGLYSERIHVKKLKTINNGYAENS
jgi:hypothetical protein